MWKGITVDDLRTTGYAEDELDTIVAELITAGRLRWAPRPPSRRTLQQPELNALVAT